ncbi:MULTISPECIES: CynX/NimT family MFS transporter [Bacillaceae]|uniref:MFS transporter n=1 Tax=Evansella alkalicola TaxID=745819 RepID=A0ABS6JPZ8_9BACI|nr:MULTISPECIES: MFS transporter [Bacillaceae]MBU9720636.1 MFS transporter [Bacillus alkalicola]
MVTLAKEKDISAKKIVLLLGILFVAFNLRPAITSVGPLVGEIRFDLGISNSEAGLITTLPLLSFAVFSLVAPKLGIRFGNEIMIFAGLIALLSGIMIRSTGLLSTLFIGTALVGVGIAISNVLLPSIVKNHYPHKIGLITGVYTTSMSTFAALGSGISFPISQGLQLGWRNALLVWSILAVIAIIIWIPQLKSNKKVENTTKDINSRLNNIWRSPLAWQVTIYMGLQSFLFYCMIAWLPEILSGSMLSISAAGWMISIMQIAGLPMTFLTPVFADRFRDQRGIVVFIGVLYIIGISSLLFLESTFTIILGVIFIGLGQGASISLALTMIGLRAASGKEAAELSGMAQSVGYALAAIGPVLIGYLIDLTGSGIVPLYVFCGIAVLLVIAGLGAGRNKTIFV